MEDTSRVKYAGGLGVLLVLLATCLNLYLGLFEPELSPAERNKGYWEKGNKQFLALKDDLCEVKASSVYSTDWLNHGLNSSTGFMSNSADAN